ncbi:hypothetical protein KBC04_05195 [Candidatus Babeliales bacterium]|nr:hypothetical protein [Candidatus Babeliales bacterium]MBP9844141.1 hypothetical protein [Candidatus Babeliales bacterium]
MFKKIVLVFSFFFVSLSAQDEVSAMDLESTYQELVYSIGMNLTEKDTICDQDTAQNALTQLAEELFFVDQILGIFLGRDPEMIENNITTIEDLLRYEFSEHYDLATAGVIWLAAFQDVFTIFTQLHPEDISFEAWCRDMNYLESWTDESELAQDADYAIFWQACIAMMEAQEDFEAEFRALE